MRFAKALLRSLFLLAADPCHSASVINVPVADTYFESYGSEKTNFGNSSTLRLDQWGGRLVFLRFDISNIPLTNIVRRATLRMHLTEVGFNEQGEFPDLKTCFALRDVTTSWIESVLTFESPDGSSP